MPSLAGHLLPMESVAHCPSQNVSIEDELAVLYIETLGFGFHNILSPHLLPSPSQSRRICEISKCLRIALCTYSDHLHLDPHVMFFFLAIQAHKVSVLLNFCWRCSHFFVYSVVHFQFFPSTYLISIQCCQVSFPFFPVFFFHLLALFSTFLLLSVTL